jgi:tRNA(Met) C34 N-acetyltransferase TmcA
MVQRWTEAFRADFASRFVALLAGAFRELDSATVLSLLQPKLTFSHKEQEAAATRTTLVVKADGKPLNGYDLKRLQVCAQIRIVSDSLHDRSEYSLFFLAIWRAFESAYFGSLTKTNPVLPEQGKTDSSIQTSRLTQPSSGGRSHPCQSSLDDRSQHFN